MMANAGVPAANGGNLYENALPPAQGERFEPLLQHRNLVIERIISSAVATPT